MDGQYLSWALINGKDLDSGGMYGGRDIRQ